MLQTLHIVGLESASRFHVSEQFGMLCL